MSSAFLSLTISETNYVIMNLTADIIVTEKVVIDKPKFSLKDEVFRAYTYV